MSNYKEDLLFYDQERQWLHTPYNKTIAYLPGKGITENENLEYFFYYIDSINHFVYGQDIEPEILFPLYGMEKEEQEQFALLKAANGYLHTVALQAVYLRREMDKLFLFFLSEEKPEHFYKVLYDKHTSLVAEQLPDIMENTLETACLVEGL